MKNTKQKSFSDNTIRDIRCLRPPTVAVGSGVWFWEKWHEKNVQ